MPGVPIVWSGLCLTSGGFQDEARGFVLGLDDIGVDVRPNPLDWYGYVRPQPGTIIERIDRLLLVEPPDEPFVHVVHDQPSWRTYQPHSKAVLTVGRAMFETSDGLPHHWAEICNSVDEIWVPALFNLKSFAAAGVDPKRLRVVPQGIDPVLFDPATPPLTLAGAHGFVFLCVVGWSMRKGWDVLVQAFVEEFRPDEDVTLYVKAFIEPPLEQIRAEIAAHLRANGLDPERAPRIVIVTEDWPGEKMPALYAAADCYVLPSRGEGWGRPYAEAMAMGLPVIASRAGGNEDFMSPDNSYLVDTTPWAPTHGSLREDWAFANQHLFQPSVSQLRVAMRRVFEERGEAAEVARRGREYVLEHCTLERSAQAVVEALSDHGIQLRSKPRRTAPKLAVRWEGPQFVHFGMAVVNRELCRALSATGAVDLEIGPAEPIVEPGDDHAWATAARLAGAKPKPDRRPDVVVRHMWPPNFDPVEDGRLVLIQPWEFGALPRAWIEPLNDVVDEVWVPSTWVRECFTRSGVDPERVHVVPNGIDPLVYNRKGKAMELPTSKKFRFLFVGGTLSRKGADLLLEAYLSAFRPSDDVCLVVKELGSTTFYRGQTMRERILAAKADPESPEILYLDTDLPPRSMPRLYRACDVLVHPYRGEGFGLPIAEAMASGLAPIVPAYGPALDFCDSSSAFLIPAEEVHGVSPYVDKLETVRPPWWGEPDRTALVQTMRHLYEHPEETAQRGAAASERALRTLRWSQAADTALEHLDAVVRAPRRTRKPRPTPLPEPRLSVCMIVKNEETLLPRALESVSGIADELVIVDTGSTDGTIDVAKRHGARVFHTEWNDDFAAARNVALEHATGDWILVLDADQEVDASSFDEIRRLIRTDRIVGYMLRQLNYLDEHHTDVLEHLNLRLFPRHPALRYRWPVHEQLVSFDETVRLEHEATTVVVHHSGYEPDVWNVARAERDLRVLERLVQDEPHEPFHAYNLGTTYRILGRDGDAEREYLRVLALSEGGLPSGRFSGFQLSSYVALAQILLKQERLDDARAYCETAVALAPDFADAQLTLGVVLAQLGRLEDSLRAYEAALRSVGRPALAPTDQAASGWKARLGIAETLLALGRTDEARTWLDEAEAAVPDSPLVGMLRARLTDVVSRS